MKRGLVWGMAGFFIFLILFSGIIGSILQNSAESGYYYGTNEWMWPVPDCRVISSCFGYRDSPTAGASSYHKGLDIACPEGTNVVATKSGKVTVATSSDTEGYWVAVRHDDEHVSYYMHNSALLVKVGQEVERGQIIALSGNTGISTGPHLHFAILENGAYVDPLNFVDPKEEIGYSGASSSGLRNEAVEFAKKYLGYPYVWGGTNLNTGVDCSGFTMKVFEHLQISIPRTAKEQYDKAIKIEREELLPGDLIFYADEQGYIVHVTMYIGNSQVIHASNPANGIMISNISYREAYAYGRYITADYSEEDLQYMAACIASEAYSASIEGQYAVGYVILNRVNSAAFPQHNTVKGVVTAPGQFNSPWNQYLNNPPEWAVAAARNVLNGSAENPIGTKCFFISYAYAHQLGIAEKGQNVGGNIFYDDCEW